MTDTSKSSTLSALPSAAFSLLADWTRQGTESFVATQKILMDLAAQQNSLALGFIRERTADLPFGPVSGLVEFAGQGVANFIAAQKILLELAAQENAIAHQAAKDGLGLTPPISAVADVIHGGVDAFVAMQRKFLDLAAEQTQDVVKSVKDAAPLEAVAGAAARAQEALKTFVETQKRFLDLVAEQVAPKNGAHAENGKNAKNGKKASHPASQKKLAELAKDGIDAFVEAEKQLVDLAASQLSSTIKAARPKSAEPSTSLAEVARRGVLNFVDAQKALLDVAAKPFLPAPPPRPAARKR